MPDRSPSLRERAEAGDPEAVTMLALLAGPPPPGYSTLSPRNPVSIAAILHRQDTRPAASLSTDPLRDGATTSPQERTDDERQ
jgi:hypothetical protein